MDDNTHPVQWAEYASRFRRREWRSLIFRDMILAEMKRFDRWPTVVDIGCGGGFDGDLNIQYQLSSASGTYWGVEPDSAIDIGQHVHQVFRSTMEEALLPPESVDVAIAVMVLEHVVKPKAFFAAVHRVLRPGGVFWGFTMDGRHYFRYVSVWTQRARVKDWYLNMVQGRRGEERYANYPTYYRANTPKQVDSAAGMFRRRECLSFGSVGQLDYFVPKLLRWPVHVADRVMMAAGLPSSVFVVRLEK